MAVYYHEGKFPPENLDWRRLAEPIEPAVLEFTELLEITEGVKLR